MASDFNRREFAAALAGVLASARAGAQAPVLCPADPLVSSSSTPLTIDTHAHFFNGSDLQIKQFLSQTTVGPDSELFPLVKAMGGVLQALAWHLAPSAAAEARAIDRYAAQLRECAGADQMRSVARPAFREGYAVGRRELQTASGSVQQSSAGAAVLGPRDSKTGLGAAIADLPPTFDEFEERRTDSATVLGSQPSLLGYLQFVLHHFNHRHVNAIDYLATYSRGTARKIDLVVASMVDYDWWLAGGQGTATPLEAQVDVMAQVSVLLGGRVHGFAPFCPFRELMTAGADGEGDAIRLVKRAVRSRGFIGVKLYPPMGFAPWGNAGKSVWKGKPTLPRGAADDESFGQRLDAAMERLFTWCLAEDVPVMAHTNHSNGPYEEFKALAGSEYWDRALRRFPGLRVSFGHFGDTDLEDHGGDRSRAFLKLLTGPGSPGANTYADSSYFAGVLMNQGRVAQTLQDLYAASEKGVLVERLMYGTDWTMILPQRHVERYLSDFMDVVDEIQSKQPALAARQTNLADAFFGRNAVAYLGLARGQQNRNRLEAFYAANNVPQPDWMRKLG